MRVSLLMRAADNVCVAITAAEPTVGEVQGELESATGPELAEHLDTLIDSRPTRVRVDLSKMGFVDGRGIWPLANASTRATATGVVRRASPPVTMLLALTDMDSVLEVESGHSKD